MMAQASSPIDPRTLEKWEDAFKYPIADVRLMERKLRSDLSVNQEKIRGLVGQSYRELLRTADQIIEMDGVVHELERHLGETSRQCNWRTVNRKAKNSRAFEEGQKISERRKLAFAAQLGILLACPSSITELLQRKDYLVASKVLCLGQLLLGENIPGAVPPAVKETEKRLKTLRRRLQQELDENLSSLEADSTDIVNYLIAYSLLNNSPPSALLQHFLETRVVGIAKSLSSEDGTIGLNSLVNALKLLSKTLVDVETIFPKRISDALQVLKARPIVSAEQVISLQGLKLQQYETLLPAFIRDYTPTMEHDDLKRSKLDETASKWVQQELNFFYEAFAKATESVSDLSSLLEFRREILRLWSANRSKYVLTGAVADEPPRERFREALNARGVTLLSQQAKRLEALGKVLQDTFKKTGNSSASPASLWNSGIINMDLHNGGKAFRNALLDHIQGREDSVSAFERAYVEWYEGMERALSAVRNMGNQLPSNTSQTNGDFDLDLEEDEGEEEKEDMLSLESAARASIEASFRILQSEIDSTVDLLSKEPTKNTKSVTARAAFLLRALRTLRKSNTEGVDLSSWFAIPATQKLNHILAEQVSFHPLATLRSELQSRKWTTPPAFASLREGDPPIPVQPSPSAFKFLKALATSLAETGDDLWGKDAVEVMKKVVGNIVVGIIGDEMKKYSEKTESSESNEKVEADKEAKEGQKEKKDEIAIAEEWLEQVLFDMKLFSKVVGSAGVAGENSLESRVALLEKLSASTAKGIQENVEAYWKRTSLLFSLSG